MRISITLFLGLISLALSAQKIIEKNIDYTNQYIELDVKFASDIKVKTWERNQVYLKADIYTEDPEFQELYQLIFDVNPTKMRITSKAEPVFEAYRKDCLAKNPSKKRNCYNTGDLTEFNYALYVPKNARFKVSSINGDLTSEIIEGEFTADLINGDIEIAKYSGTLDLSTINGEIDLRMVNTSLTAETIHGNIYADEKLTFKFSNRHIGQKIAGSTENATSSLRLNTINGNMYLRL
ncbi:hypothetical protein FK220_013610 [Flavobacteriaceae bacterium TP-CH-4]|uniref:Adhesin domain-containing protein n=1 Tax=Pelagihabitans pacificus TaxID=2696054 RepID=A0A967AWE7_9FLAO|nr:hypothetical protein [Pelagihabitans pacificus]NHF60385.1 hypothetical protein [Pelagihabitans pacificus]